MDNILWPRVAGIDSEGNFHYRCPLCHLSKVYPVEVSAVDFYFVCINCKWNLRMGIGDEGSTEGLSSNPPRIKKPTFFNKIATFLKNTLTFFRF